MPCADHRLDTPEGGQTGQAGFRHRVSHPSKTSPRQQPYRITAAVALLPFTGDAHLRGGWRPSVGLDVVTRARSEEHRLGLGHRPSRCSGSHRRSHCLELRRVEPLGHEDRETAWMLFHSGLPRRGRSHQARTRSHTARTVPGGSEPALLLATEVVGGLCLLPAGAVVQARTWLRLQRSRRADLLERRGAPTREIRRPHRDRRLFRARSPPTDSEEPAEHARSASRPLPSLPSHTSEEMRSGPARLQGVAPPTSPLRPRAVASTRSPASSMGLVSPSRTVSALPLPLTAISARGHPVSRPGSRHRGVDTVPGPVCPARGSASHED
jgi:hypothetical protein